MLSLTWFQILLDLPLCLAWAVLVYLYLKGIYVFSHGMGRRPTLILYLNLLVLVLSLNILRMLWLMWSVDLGVISESIRTVVLGQTIPSLNIFLLLNHVEIPTTLLFLILNVDIFIILMKWSFGIWDYLGRVFVVLCVESLSCTTGTIILIFKTENFRSSSASHICIFLECSDVRLELIISIFVDVSETHDVLQHLMGEGARLTLFVLISTRNNLPWQDRVLR